MVDIIRSIDVVDILNVLGTQYLERVVHVPGGKISPGKYL